MYKPFLTNLVWRNTKKSVEEEHSVQIYQEEVLLLELSKIERSHYDICSIIHSLLFLYLFNFTYFPFFFCFFFCSFFLPSSLLSSFLPPFLFFSENEHILNVFKNSYSNKLLQLCRNSVVHNPVNDPSYTLPIPHSLSSIRDYIVQAFEVFFIIVFIINL